MWEWEDKEEGGHSKAKRSRRSGVKVCSICRGDGFSTGTHMGVEWEVEVPSELLNGAATPILKHMEIGLALELEEDKSTKR